MLFSLRCHFFALTFIMIINQNLKLLNWLFKIAFDWRHKLFNYFSNILSFNFMSKVSSRVRQYLLKMRRFRSWLLRSLIFGYINWQCFWSCSLRILYYFNLLYCIQLGYQLQFRAILQQFNYFATVKLRYNIFLLVS